MFWSLPTIVLTWGSPYPEFYDVFVVR